MDKHYSLINSYLSLEATKDEQNRLKNTIHTFGEKKDKESDTGTVNAMKSLKSNDSKTSSKKKEKEEEVQKQKSLDTSIFTARTKEIDKISQSQYT